MGVEPKALLNLIFNILYLLQFFVLKYRAEIFRIFIKNCTVTWIYYEEDISY